jgi:hypothetical protein
MDDENTQSEPVTETPAPSVVPVSESAPASTEVTHESVEPVPETPKPPVEEQSIPAAETSTTTAPVPEQDLSQSASEPAQTVSAQPAPAPLTPQAPQPQSLAQQDQKGFIRTLLAKAQAKIQFNKQKKLEKLIELAQKKKLITNSDTQKLLRISDRTATRYLVKLVQQGRLLRVGDPRDAKYQFVR